MAGVGDSAQAHVDVVENVDDVDDMDDVDDVDIIFFLTCRSSLVVM